MAKNVPVADISREPTKSASSYASSSRDQRDSGGTVSKDEHDSGGTVSNGDMLVQRGKDATSKPLADVRQDTPTVQSVGARTNTKTGTKNSAKKRAQPKRAGAATPQGQLKRRRVQATKASPGSSSSSSSESGGSSESSGSSGKKDKTGSAKPSAAPRTPNETARAAPPRWEKHWSKEYGVFYYWDPKTDESSWELPTS